MKIDFQQINNLAQKFYEDHREDINHLDDRYVYTIEFAPGTGKSRIHMQWPYFRDLVANEASSSVRHSVIRANPNEPTLHFECKIQHTLCVAVMLMQNLRAEFELLGLLDEDHPINFNADIEDLFSLWQHLTGWGLDWPGEVATHG